MENTDRSTKLKEKFKILADGQQEQTAQLAATYAKSLGAVFTMALSIAFRSTFFYIAQLILSTRLPFAPLGYWEVAGVYSAYEVFIHTIKENLRGWKRKD